MKQDLRRNLNCNEFNTIDEKVKNICKYEYEFFFRKANVVCVALGYKIKNNCNTFRKCIKVYVKKKCSINELKKDDIIPLLYRGIETDVVESGEFKFASLTSKIRPVIGGYSISPAREFGSGSVGCLVKDSNNIVYILSCAHVMSRNRLFPGYPIIQPGFMDGGQDPLDIVANLTNFIPLRFITPTSQPINIVDCATAELIHINIATQFIALIGFPRGSNSAMLGEKVKKAGRTTGLTTGIITDMHATAILTDFEGNLALFQEQVITNCLVRGGDSGSVLLNENNEIIGLICGESLGCFGVVNDINSVLNALNVSIVIV